MVFGLSAKDVGFLLEQRWFAGKARRVEQVDVIAAAPLGEKAFATLVRANYADGGSETYFVPLVSADGTWTDGLADERVCRQLLELIAEQRGIGSTTPTPHPVPPRPDGELRGARLRFFDEAEGIGKSDEPVRPASHDQSNSAVSFGDRWFLKIFRKVEPGINPDYEIARYLTEQKFFTRLPRLAGALEWKSADGTLMTLATLQELVTSDGCAWDAMLCDVRESLDQRRVSPLDRVRVLGRRTAEMHQALAADTSDPAFRPEQLSLTDCQALSTRLQQGAESVLQALQNSATTLTPETAEQVEELLRRGPAIVTRFANLLATDPQCMKTRIHGDYHLGQVLCDGGDFLILDFEGEPARSLAERRKKDSPLRDVAGMLRSFGYAAYAGLFTWLENRSNDRDIGETVAANWQQSASAAFLQGYFETADDAAFLPADPGQRKTLLEFFVVEKALYEIQYELNNRPAWLKIPLAGILQLA